MAADPKELMQKYVADLHSLEEHGHKAISRQVDQLKDSGFPDVHQLVLGFNQILDRHTDELEQHLKSMGGSVSSPVQDAASSVAGAVAGMYNAVRSEEASKSIRDDYTFFSHTAIASLVLYTAAKSLGFDGTAHVAEKVYQDAARCVERIDSVMPSLVVAELEKDGFNARDVSGESHQLIHSSWGTSTDTGAGLRGGQATTASTGGSAKPTYETMRAAPRDA